MNICDIVVYMALGILGMTWGFISMMILAYGYMKDVEQILENYSVKVKRFTSRLLERPDIIVLDVRMSNLEA